MSQMHEILISLKYLSVNCVGVAKCQHDKIHSLTQNTQWSEDVNYTFCVLY